MQKTDRSFVGAEADVRLNRFIRFAPIRVEVEIEVDINESVLRSPGDRCTLEQLLRCFHIEVISVDDLLQETYLKLCVDKCRVLLEFARQHSDEAVLAYIKTIAINVVHDHFKSLHSQKRGAGETDQLQDGFDPAAQSGSFGGPEAMEHKVFLQQVHQQLQNCAAGSNQERDCLIFWFYYLQGMSAKAIAALATIKLTAKGVEAVIFRLTRCVRKHLGNSGTADSAEA